MNLHGSGEGVGKETVLGKDLAVKLEKALSLDPVAMADSIKKIMQTASPEELENPELKTYAKRAIIKFISDCQPVGGMFIMMENNLRFIRKYFKVSPEVIDEEVIEAAEAGLERSVQALVVCEDVHDVGALLFWIDQYTDIFNCKLRGLNFEEQRKVSRLLVKVAEYGMSNVLDHFFSLFHLYDLDEPEVGDVDHRKEEKEKSKLEDLVFKQREIMSEVASRLDYRAKGSTKKQFVLSLQAVKVGRLPDLPAEISSSILSIGEKYLKNWEHVEDVFSQLRDSLGKEAGPEELGRAFFVRALGSAPTGIVRLSQQETMVIFEFQAKSDYDIFFKKYYGSELANKPSVGRHCYGNTIVVNDKNLEVSVVLIDGSAGLNKEGILSHERHHAIDAVIDPESEERRNKYERKKHLVSAEKINQLGTQWALEEAAEKLDKDFPHHNHSLVGIKMEFMAFLVDGTDPLQIPKRLTSSTAYEDLFQVFKYDAKTYAKLLSTLDSIARKLSDLLSFDRRPDARQRLVYHIKDIPLRRVAKYLEKLDKYRRKTRKDFPFSPYENKFL